MSEAIRLGVSACLLGQAVRYDGSHKRDRFLTEVLGAFVEWVPVCPEVEAGLGLPRPPMRLVRDGGEVHLVEIRSGRDHTRALRRQAARRVRALRELELCGYVLKQGSPSCGARQVPLQGGGGRASRRGTGLFAEALMRALPCLPVEEEGRLEDPARRENFIERVFAYRRLRGLFAGRLDRARVLAFHAAHELQLMAHSPEACRVLGRRVAAGSRTPATRLRDAYATGFMAALSRIASRARNARVLRHAAACLEPQLDAPGRAELAKRIREYRGGRVPWIVPVDLLCHHARTLGVGALQGQTFLEPHPAERALRSHA